MIMATGQVAAEQLGVVSTLAALLPLIAVSTSAQGPQMLEQTMPPWPCPTTP